MKQTVAISTFFALSLMCLTNASEYVQDENHDPRSAVKSKVTSPKRKKDYIVEENLPVQKKFANDKLTSIGVMQGFNTDKDRAQRCIDKASIEDLRELFMKLSADDTNTESFYEQECKTNNITKWPSQASFKEAYLGEIFYPKKAIDLFHEHDSNEYLLLRFDVLCSLALSSRFHNPVAQCYLTNGLAIHLNKVSDCKADFLTAISAKAIKTLEIYEESDVSCFVRARAHMLCWRGGYDFSFNNVDTAYKLYIRCNSKEGQLRALQIRQKNSGYNTPTREEYTVLAQTYPKAYVDIAHNFSNDFDEKVRLLNDADQKGYRPALLELGQLYEEADQKEEASKCYQAYSAYGSPVAYMYRSMLYVQDVNFARSYKNKSDDEINKAIQELQQAHDLHHPDASYRLGVLLLEQHRRANSPILETKATECLQKAAFLGAMNAYEYIDDTKEIFGHLTDRIKEVLSFMGYHS